MNNRRILFVDDDPALLDTYARLLGRTFEVQTAQGAELGLGAVEKSGPFAAIISDLRMPKMNGVEFLARARKIAPDSIRVMLTGFADADAAAAAVNEGQIFRFLTKPCLHGQLTQVLEACVEQYRLVTAERELLEKTLVGSIRVLTEVLSLSNPCATSRATRLRRTMGHFARQLHLTGVWQYELAGFLSQIGCMTISPEIMDKIWAGQELSAEEEGVYNTHPAVGSQLLAHIPRLGAVARMIALQLGGETTPAGPTPAEEPTVALGGRMLRLAVALDQQLTRGLSVVQVLAEFRDPQYHYGADLLTALETLTVDERPNVLQLVRVAELRESMIFADDVRARNGMLLAVKGNEVSEPVSLRLKSFANSVGVVEPIRVWIPEGSRHAAAAA